MTMHKDFTRVLEKAKDHVLFVDKAIKQKIALVDNIFKGITIYLEVSETANTMLEATGVEIQGKGKADPRTVLGRRNGLFVKEKKGVSLSDYYGEKAKSLFRVSNSLQGLIKFNNKEISIDKGLGGELSEEIKESREEENQPDKKIARKIKRIEKILHEARLDLKKEFSISEEEIKVYQEQINGYVYLRKIIFAAGDRLKRLCGFFPKTTYKKLVKEANRERRVSIRLFRETHKLMKDFREELQRLNFIAKDLNQCFRIAENHKDFNLKQSLKFLNNETKHVNKLNSLSKVEKRFERRLKKVHDINDFQEEKTAEKFDKDLRNEEKDLEKLEEEEKSLIKIEQGMEKIEKFTVKLLNFSSTLSHQLTYFLRYTTRAYSNAGKFKRNPSAITPYLNKVKDFVEKSTGKLLHKMQAEENKLKEEIGDEKELFEDFGSILKMLTKTTDRKMKRAVSKSIKHVNQIEKDLIKSFKNSIKNLEKEESQEKKAKRSDRKIDRRARKANIQIGNKYLRNAVKEKGNLKKEKADIEGKQEKLSSEIEKVKSAFSIVQKNIPGFNIFNKRNGLGSIYKEINKSFSEEKQIPRDINHVMGAYNDWLANFFDGAKYIEFVNKLHKKAYYEEIFLKQFHVVFVKFGKNEEELNKLFENLKQSMNEIAQADRILVTFEKEFAPYLEVSKDLFQQTKKEFSLVSEEIGYISKLEKSVNIGINSISVIESAIEHVEENNKETLQSLKEAKKNIKPKKIITENIISADNN